MPLILGPLGAPCSVAPRLPPAPIGRFPAQGATRRCGAKSSTSALGCTGLAAAVESRALPALSNLGSILRRESIFLASDVAYQKLEMAVRANIAEEMQPSVRRRLTRRLTPPPPPRPTADPPPPRTLTDPPTPKNQQTNNTST